MRGWVGPIQFALLCFFRKHHDFISFNNLPQKQSIPKEERPRLQIRIVKMCVFDLRVQEWIEKCIRRRRRVVVSQSQFTMHQQHNIKVICKICDTHPRHPGSRRALEEHSLPEVGLSRRMEPICSCTTPHSHPRRAGEYVSFSPPQVAEGKVLRNICMSHGNTLAIPNSRRALEVPGSREVCNFHRLVRASCRTRAHLCPGTRSHVCSSPGGRQKSPE